MGICLHQKKRAMSFSSDVKEELARILPDDYHCLLAEAAAILRFAGHKSGSADNGRILVETENVVLAKKYLRLIKKAFDISVDLEIRKGASGKTNMYRIELAGGENKPAGNTGADDLFRRVWLETADWEDPAFSERLLVYSCCRRAFIRGAFLASGSVSDPGKSYHFEILCAGPEDAEELTRVIETFDLAPKTTERKHRFPVYLKDSEAIVDILNVMGASRALMDFENVRIIKGIKNSANRQSNCDAANITKTVQAASRQLDDIRLIEREIGLSQLSPQLREIAEVRLAHPEESLKELGEHMDPPVGKSGVNHRLGKLSQIAAEFRTQE